MKEKYNKAAAPDAASPRRRAATLCKYEMENRLYLILVSIIFIFFAGCASQKYEMVEYPDKNVEGWVVRYGVHLYSGFTKDEFGAFPTDKGIAEARFKRRKKFLEEYYGIESNATINARNAALAPAGVVLIPYMFVENLRYQAFEEQGDFKVTEKEWKEREKRTEFRFPILREFIAQDMANERSIENE